MPAEVALVDDRHKAMVALPEQLDEGFLLNPTQSLSASTYSRHGGTILMSGLGRRVHVLAGAPQMHALVDVRLLQGPGEVACDAADKVEGRRRAIVGGPV